MKKIIALALCVSLIAAVFGGCSAEEKADFNGNADEYVYMYEEGRNRDWEEDIIYLAKTFLEMHPTLVDGNVFGYIASPGNLVVETVYCYDENVRKEFIDMVNLLIPKIDEISDLEIFMEINRIIAITGDGYSYIGDYSIEKTFPVRFWGFCVDGEYGIYVRAISEEYSHLMYSKLESINGISIKEIVKNTRNFVAQSEGSLYTRYSSCFETREYLAAVGVMEYEDETVTYCFVKEDGTKEEVELKITSAEDVPKDPTAGTFAFFDIFDKDYFYEMIDEETIYIRIAYFNEAPYYSFGKMANEISSIAKNGSITKTIIDFRGGAGGSTGISGYDTFLKTICEEDFGNVYILNDGANQHIGVYTASIIRRHNSNAVIVGSASEGPNFYTHNGPYFYLPNNGFRFTCSDRMLISWPGYEYDVLMPDIEIYQTVEDYKNGVDTVLEAVLAME